MQTIPTEMQSILDNITQKKTFGPQLQSTFKLYDILKS